MSKRKSNGVCFLDVKDLLKFDPSFHYFSSCPAWKELVSDHKDDKFQRQQLSELSQSSHRANDLSMEFMLGQSTSEDDVGVMEKQNFPISVAEAAVLVQQVSSRVLHIYYH